LKEPHSSYPRNELLADIFFKAGFIEAWGRGTIKIVDKCKERNLPEPDFSEMTGGFLVSFFKPKATEKERLEEKPSEKVTEKVTKNQSTILSAMRKNPHITVKELANMVGISERKIKENINKLKKLNLLERAGSARSGYWKVYRQD
jgi:ATP-dependent DNA helicase RecG